MIDANCPVISLRVHRMVILSRSSLLFDRTKFERAGMIIEVRNNSAIYGKREDTDDGDKIRYHV